MVAVTAGLVRAQCGIDSTTLPSDATIQDMLTLQAAVLAQALGKTSIDYGACTGEEAAILTLRVAGLILLSTPTGTEGYHITRAKAMLDLADEQEKTISPSWSHEMLGVTT